MFFVAVIFIFDDSFRFILFTVIYYLKVITFQHPVHRLCLSVSHADINPLLRLSHHLPQCFTVTRTRPVSTWPAPARYLSSSPSSTVPGPSTSAGTTWPTLSGQYTEHSHVAAGSLAKYFIAGTNLISLHVDICHPGELLKMTYMNQLKIKSNVKELSRSWELHVWCSASGRGSFFCLNIVSRWILVPLLCLREDGQHLSDNITVADKWSPS